MSEQWLDVELVLAFPKRRGRLLVLEANLDTGWWVTEHVDILRPSVSMTAWDGKEYFLLHHQSRV